MVASSPLAADNSDALVLTIGPLVSSFARTYGGVGAGARTNHSAPRSPKDRDGSWRPTSYSGHRHSFAGRRGEARNLRRAQLKPRRDLLVSLLRRQLPEWKFRVPSGGIFLWVKLPQRGRP